MSLDWKHLPSLSSLRAFQATARNGGFSGAGRALNVTHAAVAQQVRQLEQELGVKLVARNGRSIGLTDAGERLARVLSDGFASIANGVESLRQQEARRSLRITTTTFFADAVILPRLAGFWAKYPGIEVAMLPSPQVTDIVGEGFDLAIRVKPVPGMDAVHLARTRNIIVGAPSLVAKGVEDLNALPWIWNAQAAYEQQLIRSLGVDTDRVRRVDLGSPHLELGGARRGLGLILASELVVRDDLASGALVELPLPELPMFDYYAVIPKGPHRLAVTQFVDWLKALF